MRRGRQWALIEHLLYAGHGPAASLVRVGKKQAPKESRLRQATSFHISSPNSISCRDRKKKRFVGQSGQEDKKKIKTESGRYISSSYKRDLYPEGRGRGAGRAAPRGGRGLREGTGQPLSLGTLDVGAGLSSSCCPAPRGGTGICWRGCRTYFLPRCI